MIDFIILQQLINFTYSHKNHKVAFLVFCTLTFSYPVCEVD